MTLAEFVMTHTVRGECQCGLCIDKGTAADPIGHTVDMVFFKVAAVGDPNRDEFLRLLHAHVGVFVPCQPLDGRDHSYIELGGWIGDQGIALQLMALGTLLNVWSLLTPQTVLRVDDNAMAMRMAMAGFVSVQAKQTT